MADVRSGAQALPQVPRVAMSAEAVATDINRQGTAIGNTQVAQNRSLPPEEWTGAAADAASSEIQKLGEKTVTLSEAFSPAATALNEWGSAVNSAISDVTGLQNEWDKAVNAYNKAIEDADAAYKAHGPGLLQGQLYGDSDTYLDSHGIHSRSQERNAAYNAASAALTTAQDDIRARYVKRLNELDDAAETAANSINSARQDIVSDEVGSQGRDAIGANLFGSDTPILSGAEQWAHAQEIAQEMADDLKKEPKTAEDVKNFNDKYGDYLQNPFYATALMQHVSLDEIYAATLDVSLNVNHKSSNPADPGFVFNKNLGAVLALATGGSNLDSGMVDSQKSFDLISKALVGKDGASVPGTIQKTLDALKETGRKEYTFPGLPEGAEPVYGYDISSQLMGLAGRENTSLTLGPGFYRDPLDPVPDPNNPNDPRHNYPRVKSVFEDMVEWDYETKAGERATSRYSGSAWSVNMVPYKAGNREHIGHLDPLQNIFTLSDTPDYLHGNSDEVLQQYEDKRLAALRYVLASDGPKDEGGIEVIQPSESGKMNMTRYLTGWRGRAANGGLAYADGGDAFGDMVNDASARTAKPLSPSDPGYKEWQADDKLRAQVAENFLGGYEDGLNHNADTTSTGEEVFGNSNPKLRSWLGTVVAQRVDDLAYMSDKANYGGMDTGHSINPQSGYSMMNLSGEQVRHLYSQTGFLADLTHDRAAYQNLSDAAWMGYSTEVRNLVGADYGSDGKDWINNFKKNTKGWDILINGIDSAPNDAGTALTEAEQRTNAEHRAIIDYVLSVAPVDKVPGIGALLSTGKPIVEGLWKDALYEKYLPTELSPEDIQRRADAEFKTDAEIGEKLNEAVQSAFIARSEWPNTAGMSKEELLAEFAKQYPSDVREDGSVPPYGQMTSEERGHLRTFLSSKNISSFADLTLANTQNAEDADSFVKKC